MRLSLALKSNDMPPVLRLMSASRSATTPAPRSAATVAAALAPEPAGKPCAPLLLLVVPAAAAAAVAALVLLQVGGKRRGACGAVGSLLSGARSSVSSHAQTLQRAATHRRGMRLSVMSVLCSRPFAIVHACSRPSVLMDTSSSSRSGPRSSQRT